MANPVDPFQFEYTNYRGETAIRSVIPSRVFYGTVPPYHPDPGWYLEAFDLDKQAVRHFDMAQIHRGIRAPAVAPVAPVLPKTRSPSEIASRVMAAIPHYLLRVLSHGDHWFVVGGAVIDLADGRQPNDFDIVVVPRGVRDPSALLFSLLAQAEYDPLTTGAIRRARILNLTHPGQPSADVSIAPSLGAFRESVPVDIAGTAVRWDGEFFPTEAFAEGRVTLSRKLFQGQRPGEDVEDEIRGYAEKYRRKGYPVVIA